MRKPPKDLSQLKLVAQITPHVEIVDVRLIRVSGRVYPDGNAEIRPKVRLRFSQNSRCSQVGTELSVAVQFTMRGVQEQDVAKKVVELSAVFGLSYRLSQEIQLTPEQLSAFSKVNAIYNAWPYWRELVQTTIARMGLPRLIVPVFRVARPRIEKVKSGDRTDTADRPRQDEPAKKTS
jgi:preprotein translocase subunit SecB